MSTTAIVKDGLRTILYRCGALGAWHRWRNRRALTVLMFHRVLPTDHPAFAVADREFTFTLAGFRRTLDFVQRHYSVVSLSHLQAARLGQAALPHNPLLITFDDGWRDTLIHAVPELVRCGLPAVLFVASEVVETHSPRWWQDALVAALAEPGASDRLCTAAGWTETPTCSIDHALAAYVGSMSETERKAWFAQYAPGIFEQIAERQMVTLNDLKATESISLAIGGHGHTHSPLTFSPDPETELQGSQRMLGQLNQSIRSMSFPHGAWSDELVSMAQKIGFDWIFNSDAALFDVSHWPSPVPALGRIHIPENAWTCKANRIDPARLATFLFFRPVQRVRLP